MSTSDRATPWDDLMSEIRGQKSEVRIRVCPLSSVLCLLEFFMQGRERAGLSLWVEFLCVREPVELRIVADALRLRQGCSDRSLILVLL